MSRPKHIYRGYVFVRCDRPEVRLRCFERRQLIDKTACFVASSQRKKCEREGLGQEVFYDRAARTTFRQKVDRYVCATPKYINVYIYITSIDTIDILINLNINITMYSMTNLSCD